jgi:hypothetical protein
MGAHVSNHYTRGIWSGPRGAGGSLSRFCCPEDIDLKLADDPNLFQQMVKKSADLLAAVRYDVSAYSEWAAQESWRPPPQA